MPLSEHEQRLFEQIERSLADDPKFASAVRANDPKHHTRRRYAVAAVAVLAGLGLLVYGTAVKALPIGLAGFLVMLGAAVFAVHAQRRSQAPDLRVVGGAATRRTRAGATPRRGGLIDRLEERWRGRPEGHR
ncbi:DUF3040 domain-containing protein [Pilimelia columellifera]|uniref:Spore wall synthesis complex protein n=1 Tax=Pilimelia columellifera subsp. columellifera TaxID=706583 RepID=A0ABN3N9W4_9ACTN